jgi:hypothetical protein
MFFDDWKWKLGQSNPEPQISDFQGATWQNLDNVGYQRALGRWQALEDEKAKQQAIFQEMARGTPRQASLAPTGKIGGGNSSLEISPFDVTARSKNTMQTLSDFDVPHFLKKWRY